MMVAKRNVFDLLKAFIAMVHIQFRISIQIVRSDIALELGSSTSGSQFCFLPNGSSINILLLTPLNLANLVFSGPQPSTQQYVASVVRSTHFVQQ